MLSSLRITQAGLDYIAERCPERIPLLVSKMAESSASHRGLEKIKRMNLEANREFEEVEQLHGEGRLMRIAPSRPVDVTRLEPDMEKLGELYWLGYQDGTDRMDAIREYLKG